MTNDIVFQSDRRALPSLIGWLSVGMLAAAFGVDLAEGTQMWWKIFGSFGLTAAVGLQAVTKLTEMNDDRKQRQKVQGRLNRQLTETEGDNRNPEESPMQIAVENGAKDPRALLNAARLKPVTDRLLQQILPTGQERRKESRTPFCLPVTLGLDEEGRQFMPGYIRDISPSGMGFKHGAPLDLGDVTARFHLPDGTDIQLRVNICWSRRLDEYWFISGGQFVDAIDDNQKPLTSAVIASLIFICAALAIVWEVVS